MFRFGAFGLQVRANSGVVFAEFLHWRRKVYVSVPQKSRTPRIRIPFASKQLEERPKERAFFLASWDSSTSLFWDWKHWFGHAVRREPATVSEKLTQLTLTLDRLIRESPNVVGTQLVGAHVSRDCRFSAAIIETAAASMQKEIALRVASGK